MRPGGELHVIICECGSLNCGRATWEGVLSEAAEGGGPQGPVNKLRWPILEYCFMHVCRSLWASKREIERKREGAERVRNILNSG